MRKATLLTLAAALAGAALRYCGDIHLKEA